MWKKNSNNTGKKPDTNQTYLQNLCVCRMYNHVMCKKKCINISCNVLQTCPTTFDNIFGKLPIRKCQSIKFLQFLKQKIRSIRFEFFSTRKHGWVYTLSDDIYVQNIRENVIWKKSIKFYHLSWFHIFFNYQY